MPRPKNDFPLRPATMFALHLLFGAALGLAYRRARAHERPGPGTRERPPMWYR